MWRDNMRGANTHMRYYVSVARENKLGLTEESRKIYITEELFDFLIEQGLIDFVDIMEREMNEEE